MQGYKTLIIGTVLAIMLAGSVSAAGIVDDRAIFSRGLNSLERGQYQTALVDFGQVSSAYVLNEYVAWYSGQAFLGLHDPRTAVTYFSKIPSASELAGSARYQLLRCKIMEHEPLATQEKYFRAKYLSEHALYPAAESAWTEFIKSAPADGKLADAYVYRGMARFRNGRMADALPDWNRGIKGYASNADSAEYYTAYYYDLTGDTAAAIRHYERLARNYPSSDWADDGLWRVGQVYFLRQDYRAAARTFVWAVGKFPRSDRADDCLYWWGLALEKLGYGNSAQDCYLTLAAKYDHSYYVFRAKDRLGLSYLPSSTDLESQVDAVDVPQIDELMALKLYQPAAEAIRFHLAKSNDEQWAAILLKYIPLYYQSGEYYAGITLAEAVISEEINRRSSVTAAVVKLIYPQGFAEYVERYAAQFQLEPALVYALIREESRFNPRAKSWAQAYGLTQIIPSTGYGIAKNLKMPDFYVGKLYDPETSIRMGCFYLSNLSQRLGSTVLAIAGYNGGPGSAKRWWQANGHKNFDDFISSHHYRETRRYIQKVLGSFYEYKRLYGVGEAAAVEKWGE